jgi:alpha-tubulin suppressor-like RCC1 family protein
MITRKPGIPHNGDKWWNIAFLALLLAASSKCFAQEVPPGVYVKKVVVAEYRVWYIGNDGVIYGYNNGSLHPVPFPIGGKKVITGVGGFNVFRVIDEEGYIWSSQIGYTTNTVRTDYDASGQAFDDNVFVDAYANCTATIRRDGSVWFFGNDYYHLFQRTDDKVFPPTRISPPGMKAKKVLLGGYRILVLTTNGQVWEWVRTGIPNNRPVQKKIPRPACDIFNAHYDVAGAIIPDAHGSKTMGYPYVWGIITSMYGGGPAYTEPTSIKELWKMKVPIKEIATNVYTIHYIDSLGRLFGIGFNVMGDVGNGQETVNKYTYPGFPNYGSNFVDYQDPTGAPPTQIGIGVKWKHLYSNNWFTFFKYGQDEKDSIYSWGRNKAMVLGNGLVNLQEQFSYNAFDVLKPTMVHPLTVTVQSYNFTPPSLTVGKDQVITGSTTTLTSVAIPPLLIKATPIAANGIDTAGYKIVSHRWTQIKGAPAKIADPDAAVTKISGLTPGIYRFNLKTVDSNTGTMSADVKVTVTGPDQSQKQ